jgi:hypothetical protein
MAAHVVEGLELVKVEQHDGVAFLDEAEQPDELRSARKRG